MPEILIVAATDLELCGRAGLVCGIGPVDAAAATARALAGTDAAAILHVGIAGGHGLEPGTVVIGNEAIYCDLAAAIPVVSRLEPDKRLLAAAQAALPDAPSLSIGTSAAVAGPSETLAEGLVVEAMEGFAVLRAAALAGVPALEVRAISNEIGETDRSRWCIEEALAALERALPRLIAAASA